MNEIGLLQSVPGQDLWRSSAESQTGGSSLHHERRSVIDTKAMAPVKSLVQRLARSAVTLTLLGETGTGKDVLARLIHDLSPRAKQPFVVFDCGAVAANLAESELLGHEKGAFTGAVSTYLGAFERAHRGTLFLDEIGELPLDLQPRLLRALENRQIRRVGGSESRNVDVRVIAATNRDLRSGVQARTFREDLFFRLAGAFVSLPALRDRKEDIPELCASLFSTLGSPGASLTPEALECLQAHHWPGNIRELKNVLGCALALCSGGPIRPPHLQIHANNTGQLTPLGTLPLAGQPLYQIERLAIEQTLTLCQGNRMRAAEMLGIAVSTLYDKIKRNSSPPPAH